ncbi:hypothetical protein T439DRAFT_97017 [Meredithblackwellia eburnea MCA 4105]
MSYKVQLGPTEWSKPNVEAMKLLAEEIPGLVEATGHVDVKSLRTRAEELKKHLPDEVDRAIGHVVQLEDKDVLWACGYAAFEHWEHLRGQRGIPDALRIPLDMVGKCFKEGAEAAALKFGQNDLNGVLEFLNPCSGLPGKCLRYRDCLLIEFLKIYDMRKRLEGGHKDHLSAVQPSLARSRHRRRRHEREAEQQQQEQVMLSRYRVRVLKSQPKLERSFHFNHRRYAQREREMEMEDW